MFKIKQPIQFNLHVDKHNHRSVATVKRLSDLDLEIHLFNANTKLYPQNQTIKISGKLDDNTPIYQDSEIETKENKLNIKLKNQFIATEGSKELELSFEDEEGQFISSSFYIYVKDRVISESDEENLNKAENLLTLIEEFIIQKAELENILEELEGQNFDITEVKEKLEPLLDSISEHSKIITGHQIQISENTVDIRNNENDIIEVEKNLSAVNLLLGATVKTVSSHDSSIKTLRNDMDNLQSGDKEVDFSELKELRIDEDGTEHASANASVKSDLKKKANVTDVNNLANAQANSEALLNEHSSKLNELKTVDDASIKILEGLVEKSLEHDTDIEDIKVNVDDNSEDIIDILSRLYTLIQTVTSNSNLTAANLASIKALRSDFDTIVESKLPEISLELKELQDSRTADDGTDCGSLSGRLTYQFASKVDNVDLEKVIEDVGTNSDKLEELERDKLSKSGGTITGDLTVNGDMAVASKVVATHGSTNNKTLLEISKYLSFLYVGNAENTTMIETKDRVCVNDFNTEVLTTKSAYTKGQVDNKLIDLEDKLTNNITDLDSKVESYIPMFAYMLDVLVRHQTGLENIQEDFHEVNTLINGHVIDRIKTLEERLGITPPSTNPEDKPQRPVITWKHESWQETSPTIWFETSDIPWGIEQHYNLTKAGLRESTGANRGVGDTWYQFNYGFANTVICVYKSSIPGFSDNLSNTVKINLFNNYFVSNIDWIG